MMWEDDARLAALREVDDQDARQRELDMRALIDVGEVEPQKIKLHVWTDEMEDFLMDNQDMKKDELLELLNEKFDTEITRYALNARFYRAKKKRNCI